MLLFISLVYKKVGLFGTEGIKCKMSSKLLAELDQ